LRKREATVKKVMIEREARKRRHRKDGSLAAMFVRRELRGVTGMSWASMLARWEERGEHSDLRCGVEDAGPAWSRSTANDVSSCAMHPCHHAQAEHGVAFSVSPCC
jgi:hypothetical protein